MKPRSRPLPTPASDRGEARRARGTRGGARPGAGRKPNLETAGVSHLRRPSIHPDHPILITLRVQRGVPSLRTKPLGRILFGAFASSRERFGARVTHFSIQTDHLHLIVEASDRRALARWVQGFSIRAAKGLNRALGRQGRFFQDRYDQKAMETAREVREGLVFVLGNRRGHLAHAGKKAPEDGVDPFSSADFFDGFEAAAGGTRPRAEFPLGTDPPTASPRTELLRRGWRPLGLISTAEYPVGETLSVEPGRKRTTASVNVERLAALARSTRRTKSR